MKLLLKFVLNLFLNDFSGNARFPNISSVALEYNFYPYTMYLSSLGKGKNVFQGIRAEDYRVYLISSSVFNRIQIICNRIIGEKGRKLGWGYILKDFDFQAQDEFNVYQIYK